MENITSREEYYAPEIKVLEVNCQSVICQSGETPEFGEGWSLTFND